MIRQFSNELFADRSEKRSYFTAYSLDFAFFYITFSCNIVPTMQLNIFSHTLANFGPLNNFNIFLLHLELKQFFILTVKRKMQADYSHRNSPKVSIALRIANEGDFFFEINMGCILCVLKHDFFFLILLQFPWV